MALPSETLGSDRKLPSRLPSAPHPHPDQGQPAPCTPHLQVVAPWLLEPLQDFLHSSRPSSKVTSSRKLSLVPPSLLCPISMNCLLFRSPRGLQLPLAHTCRGLRLSRLPSQQHLPARSVFIRLTNTRAALLLAGVSLSSAWLCRLGPQSPGTAP